MRKFHFRIHSLRRYLVIISWYGPEWIRARRWRESGAGNTGEERRKVMNEPHREGRGGGGEERRTDDRAERKRVFLAVTHCCWLLRTTLNRALPLRSAYKLTQRSRTRYKRDTHEREISLPNIVFLTKGAIARELVDILRQIMFCLPNALFSTSINF